MQESDHEHSSRDGPVAPGKSLLAMPDGEGFKSLDGQLVEREVGLQYRGVGGELLALFLPRLANSTGSGQGVAG